MNKIMVSNQKGGCGKTATTLNVAYNLAKDNNVLVIDLDAQINLTKLLLARQYDEEYQFNKTLLKEQLLKNGSDNKIIDGYVNILNNNFENKDVNNIQTSILDILSFKCKDYKEAIVPIPMQYREASSLFTKNIFVIPGDRKIFEPSRLFNEKDDLLLLRDLLEFIEADNIFDYVLIDLGPARSLLLFMAYLACDYSVVPIGAENNIIDGLIEINDDIKSFKEQYKFCNNKIIGYFNSMAREHTKNNKELKIFTEDEETENFFGCKPLPNIKFTAKIVDATNDNKPIGEYAIKNYDSQTKLAKRDYARLTDEIIKRIENDK